MSTNIFTLHIRKLKPRDVKSLVPNSDGWALDLNGGSMIVESMFSFYYAILNTLTSQYKI